MSFEEIIEGFADGTPLTKGVVLDLYRRFGHQPAPVLAVEVPEPKPTTWRERIWTCPDETQLSVSEFAEAANRKRSWGYEHAADKDTAPVHHDEAGRPYFVAGEVRAWLRIRGMRVVNTKEDSDAA